MGRTHRNRSQKTQDIENMLGLNVRADRIVMNGADGSLLRASPVVSTVEWEKFSM